MTAAVECEEWTELCFGAMDAGIADEVTAPSGAPAQPEDDDDDGWLLVRAPRWFFAEDSACEGRARVIDQRERLLEAHHLRLQRAAAMYAERRYEDVLAVMDCGEEKAAQRSLYTVESVRQLPAARGAAAAPLLRSADRCRTALCLPVVRERAARLDVIARCHRAQRSLAAAVRCQRALCALRPSVHALLTLARWSGEAAEQCGEAGAPEGLRERAELLLQAVALCPVHAQAWLDLSALFADLAQRSPSAALCDCGRASFLHCALLCASLVVDLTNFTLEPACAALPHSLYPAWQRIAAARVADLSAALTTVPHTERPRAEATAEGSRCPRCASVCGRCWRPRLHRFACAPLRSLFAAERAAEQRPVEGADTRRRKGRRERGSGDRAEDEDADAPHADRFDALQL